MLSRMKNRSKTTPLQAPSTAKPPQSPKTPAALAPLRLPPSASPSPSPPHSLAPLTPPSSHILGSSSPLSFPTLCPPFMPHKEHSSDQSLPLNSLVLRDSSMADTEPVQGNGLHPHPFSPSVSTEAPPVSQTIVMQGLPDLPHARAALPSIQGRYLKYVFLKYNKENRPFVIII